MTIEPATLTITGMIATVLSLVFAFAAHATTKKRHRERAHLEAMLKAQREETSGFVATPAAHPSQPAYEAPAARTPPTITIPAERPQAPAAQYVPSAPPAHAAPPPRPALAAPPIFKQYVTRPGTKATTPIVEAPPTDKDYVWE
jgi:hypothetical protein